MTLAPLALSTLALLAALDGAQTGAPTSAKPAPAIPTIPQPKPAVTRAEVEAHVRFLASDELAGRVTGTPECDRAAAYLAEVLRAQGAQPAGDDGTFLQKVALERPRLKSAPKLAFVSAGGQRDELAYGTDFDAPWNAVAADALRVVVVQKKEELPAQADRGVALFVDTTSAERRRWLEGASLGAGEGFGAILAPGQKRAGRPRDAAALTGSLRRAAGAARRGTEGVVRVHGAALERLRAGGVARIALVVEAEVERVTSSNVVARIPGSAPRGADVRAVVISAHYDHIADGHGPAKGTDTIFNGADDDASGVATVLEIAGALKPGELAADVIVLLATGEEVGLLGTEEYLDRPVVALDRTLANLNFEMLGRPDAKAGGKGGLWLTGDELTNLGAALRERKLRVVADPRPDQNFFQRSDNYAFVLRGVVGQTLSTYDLHADYHTPSDEADAIDFDHLTECATTSEKIVRLVAGGELAIAWTAGKAPVPPRR